MFIEHPDHTGASGNPYAPWNAPDAPETVVCRSCHSEFSDLDEGEECPTCEDDCVFFPEPDEADWDSMPGGADDW